MTRKGASVPQRRVSTELRALRLSRGLSCADVAGAIGCSESKISRMEAGNRGLRADEVAAILGYLRAPAALRQELVDLVRAGEHRNWHAIHGKLPNDWKDLIGFEADATALYNYEPLLIPGLAQTPDYARAIIEGTHDGLSEAELNTLVATRMARQVVLGRAQVHLLIDEGALRRHLGEPAMMRAQAAPPDRLGRPGEHRDPGGAVRGTGTPRPGRPVRPAGVRRPARSRLRGESEHEHLSRRRAPPQRR